MIRTKRCTRCRVLKAVYAYHRHGATHQAECKDCHRTIARESARRRYQVRKVADLARKKQRYATDAAYRAYQITKARARYVRLCDDAREEAA